ncbi:MAG: hypothetical protein GY696_11040 [Gammaproteobacteria bacterium]|nr:hypothetical protein [Gammaproteobacteria bacterium]
MACEEGVPVPPQSVISRVETFISEIQRHRDGTLDQGRRPIPTPRGEKEAAKGGEEESAQPSECHQQGTGRRTGARQSTHGQTDLVYWLIWLCLVVGVQACQMEYQDCRDPTRLERYSLCCRPHTRRAARGENLCCSDRSNH